MKYLITSFIVLIMAVSGIAKPDPRVFELRVYHCLDGRRPALIKRFQEHTTRIFEKHGMENIAYFLPTSDEQKNDLIYILAYPSIEAREASWKAFMADPEWQKVAEESQKDGKIVASVDANFMKIEPELTEILKLNAQNPARAFELRSYYCFPGRYPNIVNRFRDHTRALFEKHGMENIAYWGTVDKDQKQPHLIYLLAYPSEAARKESWGTFGKDPVWIAAKEASEADAKIVERVVSVMMEPLPFSKIQ
jgi:hypothetical protein